METLQKCGRKAKRNLAKEEVVCWPNVYEIPHALIGQMSVGQVSVDQMSVGQVIRWPNGRWSNVPDSMYV